MPATMATPTSTNGANGVNGINGANGTNEVNGTNGSHKDLHFDSIEESIEAFKRGEFLVVLDSTDRENEGDLIMAAQDATTEKMAFMVRHTSGYVCVPMNPERTKLLDLPQMVPQNQDTLLTAYTITADYAAGTTTGISAHDRALTARKLADPSSKPAEFRRPGHMLPLRARKGGVRVRRGHTEAATDLCRLAGKEEVGIICEIVKEEDGLMARRDDCIAFARRWGIKVCTIEDMVDYIEAKEGKWVDEA